MTFWAKLKTTAGVLVVAAVMGAGARVAMSADDQGRKLPGSEIIPADRQADWRPGITVGVPGGIPTDRNNLIDVTKEPYKADKTGATDASGAIQKAIGDAKEKEVVYLPAGRYRVDKGLGLKSNVTLRGAGPDKTVIMGSISIGGGGADWWYENKLKLNITGSPKRGATELTVGDTKALDAYPNGGIGQLCQLSLKNDLKLPVMSTKNFDYMRNQECRIVAKTPVTVTISPGLLFDLSESLAPRLAPAGHYVEFVGVENLTIEGRDANSHIGLGMSCGYGCWVKNVTVSNISKYDISIGDSLQCEIRHCYLTKIVNIHGAGLLFGTSSFCLVEDNVIVESWPHIEVCSASGNVFAYNFCNDSCVTGLVKASINSNHNAHNSFNLYEGNVSPKFQSDGYWGSASHCTAFRNWFHGTSEKTKQFWICVNLNRFTRDYNIVGNILGRKGYTWLHEVEPVGFSYDKHFIYSLGYPNIGNGWSNGKTAQLSKGKPWEDWEKLLASERGDGPGAGGFQELDLDVRATTLLLGNYNYKDNAVPASESLGDAKLPKSLYLKDKPEWFGNQAWPPFGPDTDWEKNKIPAQVRYEEMTKSGK